MGKFENITVHVNVAFPTHAIDCQ